MQKCSAYKRKTVVSSDSFGSFALESLKLFLNAEILKSKYLFIDWRRMICCVSPQREQSKEKE